MKYKRVLWIIFFFMLIESKIDAQELKTENVDPNYYSTITIGAIEGFSFSFGKFFASNFSIAMKFSMFATGSGGLSTHAGIGIGCNYHFRRIVIFEYLSADYIKIFEDSHNGYAVEVIAGNNTNSKKGFGFVYELGIGYSDVKAQFAVPQYRRLTLLGPVIKLGLNYNF